MNTRLSAVWEEGAKGKFIDKYINSNPILKKGYDSFIREQGEEVQYLLENEDRIRLNYFHDDQKFKFTLADFPSNERFLKLKELENRNNVVAAGIKERCLDGINIGIIWPNLGYMMKFLSLKNRYLTRLPEDFHKDPYNMLDSGVKRLSIRAVDISNNRISFLSENLMEVIKNLSSLYAANNRLDALPEGIVKLDKLEKLDISGNGFTTLPKTIGQLRNLKTLQATLNRFTNLPEGLNLSQTDLTRVNGENVNAPLFLALQEKMQEAGPIWDEIYTLIQSGKVAEYLNKTGIYLVFKNKKDAKEAQRTLKALQERVKEDNLYRVAGQPNTFEIYGKLKEKVEFLQLLEEREAQTKQLKAG